MAGTTFWIPLLPVIGIGRCGLYEFLETEGYKYTIRLKVNAVLQAGIGHLLTRPVGRLPTMCAVSTPSSAIGPDRGTGLRVVAKDEWHPGEQVPRVGFTVTNLARPAKRVVVSCIQRGTAEQHIKKGVERVERQSRARVSRYERNTTAHDRKNHASATALQLRRSM